MSQVITPPAPSQAQARPPASGHTNPATGGNFQLDARTVKEAARGRWGQIFRELAPALAPAVDASDGRRPQHVACPVHGSNKRSGGDGFRFFNNWRDTGGGVCNTCGAFSDGFKVLCWVTGQSFGFVLREVAVNIGLAKPVRGTPRRPASGGASRPASSAALAPSAPEAEDDMAVRQRLSNVFKASVPLDGPQAEPGRLYLQSRGLSILPAMLRVHPGLNYFHPDGTKEGPYPTLISLVLDREGQGLSLHRIYLTAEGRKAPVPEVKKLMSHPAGMSMRGAAIRLFPPARVMAVAEGIETAIAVTEATGVPCWSTISASFLPYFVPPPGTGRLIVFADKDRPTQQCPEGPGLAAANRLAENLRAAAPQLQVGIALPELPLTDEVKTVDWLDEFVARGTTAFRKALLAGV
jgi:putative DNA primase/helicase